MIPSTAMSSGVRCAKDVCNSGEDDGRWRRVTVAVGVGQQQETHSTRLV
jgi:hypothetical protein